MRWIDIQIYDDELPEKKLKARVSVDLIGNVQNVVDFMNKQIDIEKDREKAVEIPYAEANTLC